MLSIWILLSTANSISCVAQARLIDTQFGCILHIFRQISILVTCYAYQSQSKLSENSIVGASHVEDKSHVLHGRRKQTTARKTGSSQNLIITEVIKMNEEDQMKVYNETTAHQLCSSLEKEGHPMSLRNFFAALC